MASETLAFNLLARDNASKVFDRVGRSAADTEGTFHKVGRGMLAVGKVAAVGLAAGVGAGAVAFKKLTGDARESERVTKLTEAIIKSTGGAAQVSAAQVAALSTAISNKTGVDDEAIQTGSNLLLTFKNVRNEVGQGANVFDRATQSAVDLSAAGFGSIESGSKMLGKALNDPIAGLTALGRAGVTFTAEQKEQIKTYVEHGNLLKAQQVILGEVESQVGGAAAATGTAMDKLKVRLGNVSEEIGARLLPFVDKAAAWLGDHLPGAMTAVSDFISGTLVPRLGQVAGFIGDEVVPKVQSFVRWVRDELAPALKRFAETVTPSAVAALGSIRDAIDRVTTAFQVGDNKAEGYGNSVTGVLKLLGPLVAAEFKMMAANVQILTTAFEVATANIRFFARIGASLIVNFSDVFLGAVASIVRGAANVADALGMDTLAGKLRSAADKVDIFKATVRGKLAELEGIGRAGGREVGASISDGIAAGIIARSDNAVATMQNTVNRLNAMARATADAHSPSRVMIQLGKDLLEGLDIGMKEGAAAALAGASDLVEKVKGKLADLRSQATQLRTGARDAVTGALNAGSLGAPGAEGAPGTPVTQQLSDFAAQANAFAGALSQAAANGLNPGLIAKIAALGPDQGLTAAQAIAALNKAEVASANASLAMADKFAANVAQTVLTTTTLPGDIAREQAKLDTLKAIRQDLRNNPGNITFIVNDATDPDQVVAAIRKYIRRNGKLRDVTA